MNYRANQANRLDRPFMSLDVANSCCEGECGLSAAATSQMRWPATPDELRAPYAGMMIRWSRDLHSGISRATEGQVWRGPRCGVASTSRADNPHAGLVHRLKAWAHLFCTRSAPGRRHFFRSGSAQLAPFTVKSFTAQAFALNVTVPAGNVLINRRGCLAVASRVFPRSRGVARLIARICGIVAPTAPPIAQWAPY